MTENLSIFDPVSPPAESIRNLSILIFVIIALIFLVVEGVLIHCIFRRRAATAPERGSPPAGTPAGAAADPPAGGHGPQGSTEPPQVYGSKPIEIAWTAAPTLIVFVLVLVTTRTLWEVEKDPPQPQPGDKALFVTVIGRQWWWEYRYDHYNGHELGFVTANELHIPAGDDGVPHPVYLTLESADVCHSYWVPRLAGKMDLIPGRTNRLWFQTARPGLYLGQCAEYCGTQHANMLIRVIAEPPKDFERWLEDERKPAVEDPAASEGKSFFLSQSCVNCHQVRGTPAKGTYAPDLTHLMSRQTIASGMLKNNPKNLRDWVRDPQRIKPGCLMPAFRLSDPELDSLVRYLGTLE